MHSGKSDGNPSMTRPGALRRGLGAPILKSGQTCWRQALAGQFALIIDAEGYFAALKSAMIRAERTIFLIGWDFDFRIHLDPGNRDKTYSAFHPRLDGEAADACQP